VAERWPAGIDAVPTEKRAICKAYAIALCADPLDPTLCAKLSEMLPPVDGEHAPSVGEPAIKPDWDRLSDRQFALLQRFLSIACGELPPRVHQPKTESYWGAFDLAAVIDRIVVNGGRMTQSDRADLCNALYRTAYTPLQTTPQTFYRSLYGSGVAEWLQPAIVSRPVAPEPQPDW